MLFTTPLLTLLAVAAGLVDAAPKLAHRAPTKILLVSDSTAVAYDPAVTPLQGWGYYLPPLLSTSMNFTNLSRGGRSTRSFINEGLWASALALITPDTVVVIEHGHNDNGTPSTGTDVGKDRATLPGLGDATITVTNATGLPEVVHTFGWYLERMISDVQDHGGVPVLSGMVPTMKWDSAQTTLSSDWPFRDWARTVAEAQGVGWVDHTKASVARFQKLGYSASKAMFPQDNTHTNAAGALLNAESFVEAELKLLLGTPPHQDRYLGAESSTSSAVVQTLSLRIAYLVKHLRLLSSTHN
ncbi:rhamnogalacturonan acetylesterase [Geopyxis carbonaria]|nr:rhamnogalacturonan acetylesterase [Geopyxis carbonaria]